MAMIFATLSEVVDLYAARGQEHYGEDVPQVDHAVQSAVAAVARDAPPALVVAALLHDIGHLLAPPAVARVVEDEHPAAGAAVLAALFGPAVRGPIALHVAAKRYLCATDVSYWATLSRASQASLRRQGGPMTASAAASFLALPYAAEAVFLRRCDDDGKRDAAGRLRFADFVPLLATLCRSAGDV